MAYFIESTAAESHTHNIGLHIVGDRAELETVSRQLVPAALGAVAAEAIEVRDAAKLIRLAVTRGPLETIPSTLKKPFVRINREDDWDTWLNEREITITTSAALGTLTTEQVRQEVKLLDETRRQTIFPIWLTAEGLFARATEEGALTPLAFDRESEVWDRLEPAQLQAADDLGATHLLAQYELRYEPFEPPIPVVMSGNEHPVLAKQDGQRFQLLSSLMSADHLGFTVP